MNGSVTINGVKYKVDIDDLTPADVLPVFRTDTSIVKTDSILLHSAGPEQNSAKKVLLPHLVSVISASVAEDVVLTIEPYYDENGEYQGMYWHYNSGWLHRTDTGEMIRVDDTAAEIAMAGDIASRAATAANNAAEGAIRADSRATGNEDARVIAENARKASETERQQAERARHTQAEEDHSRSVAATGNANTQAGRAKNWADHPPYIADGTQAHPGDLNYWYLWNESSNRYVKSPYAKGDDLHWDEMSDAEKQELARSVRDTIVFATTSICQSIIDELT